MIAFLEGKIVDHGPSYLVVKTGGVGYKIFVCPDLLGEKEIKLYIHHYIREDVSALYGFKTKEELEIFELLLSVSGVGPKAALAIVAGLGAKKTISAISSGEATLFKTIPGIGNKVAAKIIVELKSRITGDALSSLLPEEDETVEALMALGYKKQEIIPHLKEVPSNLKTIQEKIKFVLRSISKRH
ncbi:MAG: Holliday junction branch migration protein RuvA [Candidatus Berkelbacteria bacterium]|nr:Holliday junction branch migration protein RuvA [Candidatus Berkelbacteria bacterium]